MPQSPRPLAILLALLANGAGALGAPDESRLLTRSPAEYAAAVEEAIAADHADQAYLNARAWARSSPGEIPPLTAMASAYLAFDAPAAALQSLEAALALGPDEAESRRIQALKTQTLLQAGDLPAAWANAREYLRAATPDDALAPILAELQWSAFGEAASMAPLGRIAERLGNAPADAPLTAARIDADYQALLAQRYAAFKKAQQAADPAAVSQAGGDLLRFLLLAHYRPDPAAPDEPLTPVYDLQDGKQALRDLSYGEHSALAISLLDWAPARETSEEEIERLAREEYLPDPPSDMPDAEIKAFLQDAAGRWSELQAALAPAIQKADTAKSEPEILAALDTLTALQNTQLASLEAEAREHALLLQVWLESLDADPEEYPLYQEARAFEDSLVDSPISRQLAARLDPALAEGAPQSLPRRLAQLYFADAQAAWDAPLAKLQKSDTPALEDFDLLVVRGSMTPELWAARLAAAERQRDWSEIVWSGFEAYARQPQKLSAWLTPFIEENDALIAAALSKLAGDNDDETAQALYDLKLGLQRDPTHLAGLQALYRHFLEADQEDFAAQTLDRLWRLSPSDFAVEDQTLALAARVGNWPLLLSLCDYRILRSDTDTQALLHRQIASIALGLNGLALDSTSAFDGTLYTDQSRILHSMALTLPNLPFKALSDPTTGLRATIQQIGQGYDDPNTLLWLALGLSVNPSVFQFEKISHDSLKSGASPALVAHISYLQGQTDADSYLAAFRHTDDEALSLFLHHYLAAQAEAKPESLAALGALSQRRDLPLFFRAKAAGLAAQTAAPPRPLRVSDSYYAAATTQDWDAVWSALVPGQLLVPLGPVELPKDTKSLPILRIAKPPRNSIAYLSSKQVFYSRLWELDGVRAFASHQLTSAWVVEEGGVVAIANASVEDRSFSGKGSLWIETSDLDSVTGSANAFFLVDVQSQKSYLSAYRHFEADQLVAESSAFQFKQYGGNTFQGQGFVSASVFLADQAELFKLFADSSLLVEDSRIYASRALDPSFNQIVFKNAYLSGAAQPQLAIASGLQFTPLKLDGSASYQAANYAELADVLAKVQPGDRIDLAPGTFVVEQELKLPAGILLRGSADAKNPSVLAVPNASKLDPILTAAAGDLWLENLVVRVESGTRDGFKIADSRRDRKALVADPGARVLLRNVDFATWSESYPDRPAVVSDNAQVLLAGKAPGSLQVANRGRIDYVLGEYASRKMRLLGNGRIYGNHSYGGELVVSGSALAFHGNSRYPQKVVFTDGAGDPRARAWRELARSNFVDTLDELRERLPARLDAARDMDERIALFKDASRRLAPIIRAAQQDPSVAGLAIALRLNGALTSRPEEFPFYMEAFYHRGARLPQDIFAAHILHVPDSYRGRLRAHFNALVGSQGRRDAGEFSASERSKLMAFMREYPVGHAQHARAIAAFGRGDSLYEFNSRLAEEEKRRRLRAEHEARVAAQRAEAEKLARQAARDAVFYQPLKQTKPWWNNSNSGYTPSYNSYKPYTSPSQTMRDYNRQLNNRIFNRGRDYGKQYVF